MTCRYCRKLLCDSLNVETEIRIYFKDGDRDLLTDSIVVVTHTSKIRGKCFDNELLSPPPLRPPLSHLPPTPSPALSQPLLSYPLSFNLKQYEANTTEVQGTVHGLSKP